jgi:hypothetical protein
MRVINQVLPNTGQYGAGTTPKGRWKLLNPNADERRTNIRGTSSSSWPGESPAAMTATVIACAMVLNDTRRMTVYNADVASTERCGGV